MHILCLYVWLIIVDYTTAIMLIAHSKWGKGKRPAISGHRWYVSNYELVFPYSIWLGYFYRLFFILYKFYATLYDP